MKNILDALMPPMLSITLSNHLSELERLHQILCQFGKEKGLPKNVTNTVNLALEEIVTNVIEHGYEDKDEHFIRIRIFIQDGQVIAEVEDDGQPFNPLQSPDPDTSQPIEARPIGGLGIYLTRNVMDTL
ncbi:MAG: ATP-binding protein, partial [Nitrospirota bacterium]